MSATMTFRLEPALKRRLDRLAESMQRSESFLAAQAIREFVDRNEWQIREMRSAIAEADRGDFASDDLAKDVLGKWGVDAPPDRGDRP